MEFFDWTMLGTFLGALAMVLIITQLTKNLKFIKKIPTKIWSYIIALAILYPAHLFTGQLSASNAILIIFNAALIALAANGEFDALKAAYQKIITKFK